MKFDAYHYWTETDGNYTYFCSLVSVHFKRMGNYLPEWTIEDILVFEALLVFSRSYGHGEFFKQFPYFEEYTRLSKFLINKSLEKLMKLGLVSVERKGHRRSNFYSVNFKAIKENLDKIYDFSEVNEEELEPYKTEMRNFFDYWSDNDYYIPESRMESEEGVVHNSRNPFKVNSHGMKNHTFPDKKDD